MAAFLVSFVLLSRSYVRSQAAPVVQVTLTREAVLDLPVVTICPDWREVPHFSRQPSAAYPGHPILAVRAFSNWEAGRIYAWPNLLDANVVEMIHVGGSAAAAPFPNCSARLNAMSVARVSAAYDGLNGLTPVRGLDPGADDRCRVCVRVGRSPTVPLTAAALSSGSPTGVSVSLTTSDAFQYCVDGRRRSADVSQTVFSRLLAAMGEKILQHRAALIERGTIRVSPDFNLTERFSSGDLRWFTYSRDPRDNDEARGSADLNLTGLIGFHCNVYFFSGYFYPSDDPPGSVAYRLNRRGLWEPIGTGSVFVIRGADTFVGISEASPLDVLAPYPTRNELNAARRDLAQGRTSPSQVLGGGGGGTPTPAPANATVAAGAGVVAAGDATGMANGGGGGGSGGGGGAVGAAAAVSPPPTPTPPPLTPEQRALQVRALEQFLNRSALHMLVYTQAAVETTPSGNDLSRAREVALVGQGERFLRLGLSQSIGYDGTPRFAAEELARSELSLPRLRFFEAGAFSEWLFDVRYTSFVTATASEAPAVSTSQYVADVANYFGAFTGLSTFTLLIVPANLLAAWVAGRWRDRRWWWQR